MATRSLSGISSIKMHPERLDIPLRLKAPRRLFVNSMSDLFHEDVLLEFIRRVFGVTAETSRHTFQELTKRHFRLQSLASFLDWPPNVWMGVSRGESVLHDDIPMAQKAANESYPRNVREEHCSSSCDTKLKVLSPPT